MSFGVYFSWCLPCSFCCDVFFRNIGSYILVAIVSLFWHFTFSASVVRVVAFALRFESLKVAKVSALINAVVSVPFSLQLQKQHRFVLFGLHRVSH